MNDGRRRYRRIAATALASAAAKGTQFLLLVVSVPLALPYLGAERYGAWMALSGLFAMLAAIDLGLPNAVLAAVAAASGRDERPAMRSALGAALLTLGGMAAALAGALALGWRWLDWPALLNLPAGPWRSECAGAAAILAGTWLAGLPLTAAVRARHGLQEGWVAACWDGAGALVALAALGLAVQRQAGLPLLALAVAGPPVLAQAGHLLHLLAGRPWLRPGRTELALQPVASLLRTGLAVFVLQAAAALVAAADPFLVARWFGAEAAAGFAVAQRLAILPNLAVGLALAPLWPAYAEAAARGDGAWIRAAFRRSLLAALAVGALSCLAVGLAGGWVIAVWTRGAVHPSADLLWAQGVWLLCGMLNGVASMLLNGLACWRVQVALAAVLVAVVLPLKAVLAGSGPAGLVWATVIGMAACQLGPSLLVARRALRRLPG